MVVSTGTVRTIACLRAAACAAYRSVSGRQAAWRSCLACGCSSRRPASWTPASVRRLSRLVSHGAAVWYMYVPSRKRNCHCQSRAGTGPYICPGRRTCCRTPGGARRPRSSARSECLALFGTAAEATKSAAGSGPTETGCCRFKSLRCRALSGWSRSRSRSRSQSRTSRSRRTTAIVCDRAHRWRRLRRRTRTPSPA